MPNTNLIRLLFKLACFLPIVLVTPAVNWISSRAPLQALFLRDFNRMADAMLAGSSIWFEADERPLKVAYINRSPSRKEVLILGSSRAMEISSTWFQPRSVFNAAVRFGGVDDSISIFELCLETGKTPAFIVLELNPSLISFDIQRKDWRTLSPYFDRALARYHIPEPVRRFVPELFSSAQFHQNVRTLAGIPWGIPEKSEGYKYETLSDGQLRYPAAVVNRPPAELDAELAKRPSTEDSGVIDARSGSHPGEFEITLFHRLLDDIQSHHIRLVVFLAPVHPIAYDYYAKRGGFDERWIRKELVSRGIPVAGSYSPTVARATSSDFFDDVHPRPAIVKRLLVEAGVIEYALHETDLTKVALQK